MKAFITPQAFDTKFKPVAVTSNAATLDVRAGNRLAANISANTTFTLNSTALPEGKVLLLRLKVTTAGATPTFSGASVSGTVITTLNAVNLIVFVNDGVSIKGFVL